MQDLNTRPAATDHFDADTRVAEVRPGVFTAHLTDRWDRLGGGPLGGYPLAVAATALRATFEPREPVVLNATFVGRLRHGDVEIATRTRRAGRRFSVGQAVVTQDGREVLTVTGTYGVRDPDGRTALFASPPALPPVEACIDPLDGVDLGGVTIADRVEYRYATPPGWLRGAPSGEPNAELWMRLAGVDHHRLDHLPLLVDAAPPMVLEIGELASSTLELTVHLRRAPAPGWLACRATTRVVDGALHEEDLELWDADGHLVAQSRQLAVLG